MPSHPTSWWSILILSSHVSLGLPSSFLPSGLSTKILRALLLSPIRTIFPAHHITLDLISRIIFGEEYRSWNSSLRDHLHSSGTPSLLGPHILLSTLFSNTRSLRSSLNVSDQVSHTHKTTRKIILLYILICIFLVSKPEDKRFCTERLQAFPDFKSEWPLKTFFQIGTPPLLTASGNF